MVANTPGRRGHDDWKRVSRQPVSSSEGQFTRLVVGATTLQTILPRIFFTSSKEKARRVWERMLPREQTLNESAVAASSSGASQIAMTSYAPSGCCHIKSDERNLPTTANVDAMDFKDLACWLIVQIGPISLNVTTPSRGFVTNAKNAFTRNAAIILHRAMITK